MNDTTAILILGADLSSSIALFANSIYADWHTDFATNLFSNKLKSLIVNY